MRLVGKIKYTCLIISFLWISLGTIIQLSAFPAYNLLGFDYNSFIYNFLWAITFPFNILLCGLLFSETLDKIYIYVIILQSAKVLAYWWIFYKIALYFQKVIKKWKIERWGEDL